MTGSGEGQCASAVLMVRPAHFCANVETAASNSFQLGVTPDVGVSRNDALASAALAEFDALVERLDAAGIEVVVATDSDAPVKPDAVFPNNWVSFHADGSIVLYPMLAPSRRLERREEVIDTVGARFHVRRTIDLSAREEQGKPLEGTGSLVLDRANRVAYACLSPRTHLDTLGDFAQELDYEPIVFEAYDRGGRPVYHTNVMMAVGERFAVLCAASIPDGRQREAVNRRLEASGHEIIDITLPQMHAFAGNVLALVGRGGPLIALSNTAWQSLTPRQHAALERHATPLIGEIGSIERHGGGSVRCMLAEIHLPRRMLR